MAEAARASHTDPLDESRWASLASLAPRSINFRFRRVTSCNRGSSGEFFLLSSVPSLEDGLISSWGRRSIVGGGGSPEVGDLEGVRDLKRGK